MKAQHLLLLAALTPLACLAANIHEAHHHLASYGNPGKAALAHRTVSIRLNDTMRFSPDSVTVKAGDTVRFVFKNEGKIQHEWVLGTPADLKEHAEMMKEMPGMAHDEPNELQVAPGGQRILVWHFTHAGTFPFACLVPGHSEAGMTGKVIVLPN